MEFNVQSYSLENPKTPCLILGVFEKPLTNPDFDHWDTQSQGYLSTLLKTGDLDGKVGQTLLIHQVPHLEAERVLLVGCGKDGTLSEKTFRQILRHAAAALLQTSAEDAFSFLTHLPVQNRDLAWKVRQAAEITENALYRFDAFKSPKDKKPSILQRINFAVEPDELAVASRAAEEGAVIAKAIQRVKDLGNMPPNICTPAYLARTAESLTQTLPLKVQVLDQAQMEALQMGALLAVAKGSDNPPQLVTLEYKGGPQTQKPIVLVGKGVTFDTGGNSLKPPASMIGMKYDMCGAATVLAVLEAAALLKLPLNITGILACAENMPGAKAARPDDIVRSMAGLTIEILNTDAEGRLILCDALTYAERFNPAVVIDIATLTGACAVTFGGHASGLLSNHPPLAHALLESGMRSGDRCWELPLWEDYQEALQSNFADMANIGNPSEAGTILGASFLARFTEGYSWAHLDVAGTAFKALGKERGATGRPVPLLMYYLLSQV